MQVEYTGMFTAIQVLTVIVVAVAMALSLAHALELPGKLRLSKEQYLGMQPIYYPGFTIGGMAEPIGLLLLVLLLILTPPGSAEFWLTGIAFAALSVMHAVYWLMTHPMNNFWLKDIKLKGSSARFFSFDRVKRGDDARSEKGTVIWIVPFDPTVKPCEIGNDGFCHGFLLWVSLPRKCRRCVTSGVTLE
jgi:hypothetical protein